MDTSGYEYRCNRLRELLAAREVADSASPASTSRDPFDWSVISFTCVEDAEAFINLRLASIRPGSKRIREDFFYEQLQPTSEKRHKNSDHPDFKDHGLCEFMSALNFRPSLFELPAELRNIIYRMVFDDDKYFLAVGETRPYGRARADPGAFVNLGQIC